MDTMSSDGLELITLCDLTRHCLHVWFVPTVSFHSENNEPRDGKAKTRHTVSQPACAFCFFFYFVPGYLFLTVTDWNWSSLVTGIITARRFSLSCSLTSAEIRPWRCVDMECNSCHNTTFIYVRVKHQTKKKKKIRTQQTIKRFVTAVCNEKMLSRWIKVKWLKLLAAGNVWQGRELMSAALTHHTSCLYSLYPTSVGTMNTAGHSAARFFVWVTYNTRLRDTVVPSDGAPIINGWNTE